MKRPTHLPDFTNPPLDEVVLGVQFSHILGFSSVDAGGVWRLFKRDFPKVVEQPMLDPQFETFGGANLQPSFQFQVGPASLGSRLWFLSEEENSLLQFQPDRFLSNWRKGGNLRPYPRFEQISASFENGLKKLQTYSMREHSFTIDVNQAEVSYINIIPVKEFSEVGEWFRIWNGGTINLEAVNASFNEVIRDDRGLPYARLSHMIQSVFTLDRRQKAFNLSITFRGQPSGGDVGSAMAFLKTGREHIVKRFGEITTERAHEIWGRKS